MKGLARMMAGGGWPEHLEAVNNVDLHKLGVT